MKLQLKPLRGHFDNTHILYTFMYMYADRYINNIFIIKRTFNSPEINNSTVLY